MNFQEYARKRKWLLEVLEDDMTRGDFYLEYDVREDLEKLDQEYCDEPNAS